MSEIDRLAAAVKDERRQRSRRTSTPELQPRTAEIPRARALRRVPVLGPAIRWLYGLAQAPRRIRELWLVAGRTQDTLDDLERRVRKLEDR